MKQAPLGVGPGPGHAFLSEEGLSESWHFMGSFCCCYMGYLVFQALK